MVKCKMKGDFRFVAPLHHVTPANKKIQMQIVKQTFMKKKFPFASSLLLEGH